uniref:Si:ch211-158m24.12 n=1 Tax=Kryptolebias marmoratus TaxID=37003 RepID=A0A3Q3A7G5_KRYMA
MHLSVPGQFLELLLASLHGQIFSFIQTVLQVLHCDLQVLLHPLQHLPPRLGSEQNRPPASSWY